MTGRRFFPPPVRLAQPETATRRVPPPTVPPLRGAAQAKAGPPPLRALPPRHAAPRLAPFRAAAAALFKPGTLQGRIALPNRGVMQRSQVNDDDMDDVLSQYSESSQQALDDQIVNIDKMKKGNKKQEIRVTALTGFGHINSYAALSSCLLTAVGKQSASQMTVITYYGKDGNTGVYSTASCSPLRNYITQSYDQYYFVDNYRAEFGDGSHVHAEGFAVWHRITTGKSVGKGDTIICSKPVCDVCQAMLGALSVTIADQGPGTLTGDKWSNPWAVNKPTNDKEKDIAQTIDTAVKGFSNYKIVFYA